jgi:hypothetical protein
MAILPAERVLRTRPVFPTLRHHIVPQILTSPLGRYWILSSACDSEQYRYTGDLVGHKGRFYQRIGGSVPCSVRHIFLHSIQTGSGAYRRFCPGYKRLGIEADQSPPSCDPDELYLHSPMLDHDKHRDNFALYPLVCLLKVESLYSMNQAASYLV